MHKEKIRIILKNEEAATFALKILIQGFIDAELLSESESSKLVLVKFEEYYVVLENVNNTDVKNKPVCKYLGSTLPEHEKDYSEADDIIWNENCGYVSIVFRNENDFSQESNITVVFDEYLYDLSERRFCTQHNNPQFLERKKHIRSYLGSIVEIHMNQPPRSIHSENDCDSVCLVNCGYICGEDGEEEERFDVYLLGVDNPPELYTAKIIGIIHREHYVKDKLIAAPLGINFSEEELERYIGFNRKFYASFVETEDCFFRCSIKGCCLDGRIPKELEHRLLNKFLCPCGKNTYRFRSWKEFKNLDEFKPYMDMDEHSDIGIHRPGFICNPRTLYTALLKKHLHSVSKLSDNSKFNLKFYFFNGILMMNVESINNNAS